MIDTLLEAVRRRTTEHAGPDGVAPTVIPGLTAICATEPSALQYAVSRPLVCLVLQGAKRVAMGAQTYDFAAGDSLLIAADVPTVSQITAATPAEPYLSLVLDLDLTLVANLGVELGSVLVGDASPVRVEPTDSETADAALRLMRLHARPASAPILGPQLMREMHYWLLCGRLGPRIRRLGLPDSQAQRIGRAVAVLREGYREPLRVEQLARAAGMSASSFHQHFRAVTSLSPLQFQKQLRLIEARRLMIGEGRTASAAAFTVGYESVSQFTREYGRMFGQSPARDAAAAGARAA